MSIQITTNQKPDEIDSDSDMLGNRHEICSICFENDAKQIIPTCRHTLCDLCYIKLSACPFCRSPYLFYKKTKA